MHTQPVPKITIYLPGAIFVYIAGIIFVSSHTLPRSGSGSAHDPLGFMILLPGPSSSYKYYRPKDHIILDWNRCYRAHLIPDRKTLTSKPIPTSSKSENTKFIVGERIFFPYLMVL